MQDEHRAAASDTPNITLRPFDLSDVDDFMVWATDDKVSKYCSWDTYKSKDEAINYMINTMIPHPWFRAICVDNRPVGAISVTPNKAAGDSCRAEMGYVLASDYWGKGIVTRAVDMAAKGIFKEWPHLKRLEALVDVTNTGSVRVMEKAGFQREGVLRKYFLQKGILGHISADCRKKVTCKSCGIPGHVSADCRRKVTCNFCGILGHKAPDCRRRMAAKKQARNFRGSHQKFPRNNQNRDGDGFRQVTPGGGNQDPNNNDNFWNGIMDPQGTNSGNENGNEGDATQGSNQEPGGQILVMDQTEVEAADNVVTESGFDDSVDCDVVYA